jgi:hypothetical protein
LQEYGRLDYDPGNGVLLNVKRRGFGNGWLHTDETKSKIRESAINCIKSGTMKTWATSLTPEERGRNVTKGNKSRAKVLFAYSPIDGSFVQEFPPYNETVEQLNLNKGKLSAALKDPRVQCGAYLWSHVKLENIGVTFADVQARVVWAARPKSGKAIRQILPDGSEKVWPNMLSAIRELGGHHRLFENAIQNRLTLFGSSWSR